mmetsp:Transcript_12537/g.53888  ORF Transcript_12537/g.53888 Transcript_12537/m.53888 type:complete len:415 (-) Transcript_12537:62-1306(-)
MGARLMSHEGHFFATAAAAVPAATRPAPAADSLGSLSGCCCGCGGFCVGCSRRPRVARPTPPPPPPAAANIAAPRFPEIDARFPFFPGASAVLVRSRRSGLCRAFSDGVGALTPSSSTPAPPKARSTCRCELAPLLLGKISPPESATAISRPFPSPSRASPSPSPSPFSSDAASSPAARSAQRRTSSPAATSAAVLSRTPVRKGTLSSSGQALLSDASWRCTRTSSIRCMGGAAAPPSAPYARRGGWVTPTLECVPAGDAPWLNLTLRRLLLDPLAVSFARSVRSNVRSNAAPSDAFTSIIATALSASSPTSARVAAESSSSSPRRPVVVFLDDRPADRTRFPPPDVVVISLAPAPALLVALETPSPDRFRSDVAPNENESSAARCARTRTSARLRSAGNDASADARKPPRPSA